LSRVTPAGTDTYDYLGRSETVWRITTAGIATSGALDPSAARLASSKGGTIGYLLPDLHGNLAAVVNAGETAIVSATRYDPFGQTAAAFDSGAAFPTPWRFQGRLDLSPDSHPLYDFGACTYDPAIGAFTALDTYPGSPGDPLSLNRFAYAEANPATLIDPDGHFVCAGEECNSATDFTIPAVEGQPARVIREPGTQHRSPAQHWLPGGDTAATQPQHADSTYAIYDQVLAYMTSQMLTNANTMQQWGSIGSQSLLGSQGFEAKMGFFLGAEMLGGRWDHKAQLQRMLGFTGSSGTDALYIPVRGSSEQRLFYDVWSNIHYGFVGRAGGIDARTLLQAQGSVDTHTLSDDISVEIGIKLYERHPGRLTTSDVELALAAALNQYAAIDDTIDPFTHQRNDILRPLY
jgi:RHS repeat-associated protein